MDPAAADRLLKLRDWAEFKTELLAFATARKLSLTDADIEERARVLQSRWVERWIL